MIDFLISIPALILSGIVRALMQPALWAHNGEPWFLYLFAPLFALGIICLASRIIWERSARTNILAYRTLWTSAWIGMLGVWYWIFSVPFFFMAAMLGG